MEEEDGEATAETFYDNFVKTVEFLPTIEAFQNLCDKLDVNTKNYKTVFTSLKTRLTSWKCQSLFTKLEKKSKHVDYKNKPCAKLKVLVIGSGPVGLRTAIELAFLGAHVMVIEKRDSFSRNNVLHLWPFLIVDLKSIGVKSFFGKFCAGSLDHISIRRLQCILLKVCLLLGVQIFPNVLFTGISEPSEGKGWRGDFRPPSCSLNSIDFDAIVGCDGKSNSLKFERKEFRGKLAIAITCNFINKQTSEEARVEEISGVAFIYNQEFFQELTDRCGVELENIVYYRDETHYFVMTAKKKSLLTKNVIKQDSKDVFKLLSAENINHNALLQYAKEAADFSTKYQLPHHEFAVNHYGKEDVAMFDFTSIHQAKSASKMLERKGKRLLLCIAGDVLLEPFWPTGSGCARGFLGALDAAWMIRGFGLGAESLDLIQERESIFTLLPQTKPDCLIRHHDKYSINPATRYLNLNAKILKKDQVRHLLDSTDQKVDLENWAERKEIPGVSKPVKVNKKEKEVDPDTLLKWCKEQTADYPNVRVVNMSTSWRTGLAFCAIINRYRPDLINYFDLDPTDLEGNCEKAFSIAEEHLGIAPKISSYDLTTQKDINQLAIMAYVSLYYEALSHETPVLTLNESREHDTNIPTLNTINEDAIQPYSPRVNRSKLVPPSPRATVSPIPSQSHSPRRFGFRIALVMKKSGKVTPRDAQNSSDNDGSSSPHKSHSSKMSILSKLSKRSKKQKSKLSKKSKKNKENQLLTDTENGVTLKSYDEKTSPRINSSSEVVPTRTSAAASKEREALTENKNRQQEEPGAELRNPTTGVHKYKRISQLAESVFGDTIVQNGTTAVTEVNRERTQSMQNNNLSESEKCHFCSRKVYVMERQSAEGMFFHRTCFRCCVCKCHLLMGNYAFQLDENDDSDGKFYCKMHYNRLIYQPKETTKIQEPAANKLSEKRRRPVTQIIQAKDVSEAFKAQSTDVVQLSPKFSRQIRDIQTQLKQNLPELTIGTKVNTPKPSADSKELPTVKVDGNHLKVHSDDVDGEMEKGPYDRFEARSLHDRHPSLLRCAPKKVTTSSFFTSSKLSISTPNLTKLIQEDSMFDDERQKQVERLNNPPKKIPLSEELQGSQQLSKQTSVKKKLSVPDVLKETHPSSERNSSLHGSDVYLERNDSVALRRENSYGAVHRRPLEERRAQYPVSMAFTDNLVSAGLKSLSVNIEIDEVVDEKKGVAEEKSKKKKKLVLKKRKVKKIRDEDTIEELDETKLPSPVKNKKESSLERSLEKSIEKSPKLHEKTQKPKKEDVGKPKKEDVGKPKKEDVGKPKKVDVGKPKKEEEDWVLVKKEEAIKSDEDILSSSSSESDEEEPQRVGLLKRALGRKPKKKALSAKEMALAEEKKKRHEKRKVEKELKERRTRRLWEAQSIQRKLNEVDLRQFELEEKGRHVEKSLQSSSLSADKTSSLMSEWFQLVNEKNTLLRFESELVIQSNSIQLEDRQARLEHQIRNLLTAERPKPNSHVEIDRLTRELVDTVEQRNALVELLEEDRLREMEEDRTLKEVFARKAHVLGMDRLI